MRPTQPVLITCGGTVLVLIATLLHLAFAGGVGATISPDPPAPPRTTDSSNFRTFCEFSHAAYDDPIVFPGQPGASHLHFFFGNTATNAHSTPESLLRRGSSTCQGTNFNKSAYWMPAVVTADGAPRIPDRHDIYYKHLTDQDAADVVALPAGLKMVAGNADGSPEAVDNVAYWRCSSRNDLPNSDTIPTCPVGDDLQMSLSFPSCWDGANLDSRDHQSHMAYTDYDNNGLRFCPASHPFPVPQLQMQFVWEVRDKASTGWTLSSDMGRPGGSTLHADWINGWHQPTLEAWTRACIVEKRDCAGGTLGDGRQLDQLLMMGSRRVPKLPDASGPQCNGRPATIVGSAADDTLLGTDGDDVIVGRGGNDIIDGRGGNDIICGGRGADDIDAGPGDDEVFAGAGDDLVHGGEDDDFIDGQRGNDELHAGRGNDAVRGGAGNDLLFSTQDYNVLMGGRGSDELTGGWWIDRLYGGAGNDVIDGIGADDRINGGPGTDTCQRAPVIRRCED
jgi:hypothetical protein